MRSKGFTCADCHGYAPPDGQGKPMWGSHRKPLCTRCACARYVRQHGGTPAEAERHLYEQRARQSASSG
jgi:hypothetical protein